MGWKFRGACAGHEDWKQLNHGIREAIEPLVDWLHLFRVFRGSTPLLVGPRL